jgi:hypothetical protein
MSSIGSASFFYAQGIRTFPAHGIFWQG